MTIRKRNGKFVLVDSNGKILGTHSSRAGAEKQEQAINIAKRKKK